MTTPTHNRRVFDPCCGSRMFWFQRDHPDVLFGDHRNEQHTLCDGRTLKITPDVLLDFTNLPFSDGQFRLVVFDPPHIVRAGPKSWLALKYGKLNKTTWKDDIRQGFSECFRVLNDDGVLVFKWNETQVKREQVLELSPFKPLFGEKGRGMGTHWYVFMKAVKEHRIPSSPDAHTDHGETVQDIL
ncbi:MAG: class I SAM-dependent methyltransferase [Magnetococcales bacterium]|nr:class I SAM-dependent methyltransferase [Magnetococcales bacterium]